MVEKPEDYPWSSYRYYALGERNNLLTEDMFYAGIGNDSTGRKKAFCELVVDDTISDFMDKDDKIAIGDKKFIYNINRKVKHHEVNRNTPYRPPKAGRQKRYLVGERPLGFL